MRLPRIRLCENHVFVRANGHDFDRLCWLGIEGAANGVVAKPSRICHLTGNRFGPSALWARLRLCRTMRRNLPALFDQFGIPANVLVALVLG